MLARHAHVSCPKRVPRAVGLDGLRRVPAAQILFWTVFMSPPSGSPILSLLGHVFQALQCRTSQRSRTN
jgi:hypothetical protein